MHTVNRPDPALLFLPQTVMSTIDRTREPHGTDSGLGEGYNRTASRYVRDDSGGRGRRTPGTTEKENDKMSGKSTAVLGIYPDYSSVEDAVDVLKAAGFRNTDISVLFPEKAGSKSFAHEKGTRAPEGAAAGAGTGAMVGGTLGWLVGIGALAIPGLGLFVAAGPIMAALAGVGVGGAVGGIAGALVGMGISEPEAKHYEVRVKEGGILLSVHSDDADWTRRAKEILERMGAQDISLTGADSADYVRSDRVPARAATGSGLA